MNAIKLINGFADKRMSTSILKSPFFDETVWFDIEGNLNLWPNCFFFDKLTSIFSSSPQRSLSSSCFNVLSSHWTCEILVHTNIELDDEKYTTCLLIKCQKQLKRSEFLNCVNGVKNDYEEYLIFSKERTSRIIFNT